MTLEEFKNKFPVGSLIQLDSTKDVFKVVDFAKNLPIIKVINSKNPHFHQGEQFPLIPLLWKSFKLIKIEK